MKEHQYKYETVVIGGRLNALLYAYYNNLPIIFTEPQPPHPFEYFDPRVDLSDFLFDHDKFQLCTLNGKKEFGQSKLKLYNHMCFLLSLAGLMPLFNIADTMRIEKTLLKIATKNSRLIQIEFDSLVIFDDHNVAGLSPPKQKKEETFEVIDWISTRVGGKHEIDYIKTKEAFVNEIFFYPSERIDGNTKIKDIAAISYLTHEDINDYRFSDTYARFKILELMKSAGIKGMKNGRNPNYPEKSSEPHKYLLPKIEPVHREVRKRNMLKYKNTKHITFSYQAAEKIIQNSMPQYDSYANKLNFYLS